jgi:hypothetical protein
LILNQKTKLQVVVSNSGPRAGVVGAGGLPHEGHHKGENEPFPEPHTLPLIHKGGQDLRQEMTA